MNIPETLLDELLDGRLVPFVGSGVSLTVKHGLFPTWGQRLEQLAARLERDAKADEATLVRLLRKKGRFYDAAEEALTERLPQDKYDLYDRITDTVLCNRYPNDPAQVDLVRNRLCVVAYGMHTGQGLGEERQTPQAETTHDEIGRLIQRYRDDSPGTERAFQGAVQVREDLLTRSGLLLPREGDRAAFYHLTFQDFLAAQRLLDLESERLLEAFCLRAERPEWRSALSFAFGSLLAKNTSPDRAIRLLSGTVDGLTPDTTRLAVVAADCLEILWGRNAGLRPEHEAAFRQYCLSAIEREVPINYGEGSPWPEARVLRGGSWSDQAWICRAAVRNWLHPDARRHVIGFRVCVSRQNSK